MCKKMLLIIVLVFMTISICGFSLNPKVLWKIKDMGEIYSVVFDEDRLIISSSDGLKCYDLNTGEHKWVRDYQSGYINTYYSDPEILNNELYIGQGRNKLARIDLETGEEIKLYDVDGDIVALKVVDNELLYIISRKDHSYHLLSIFNLSTELIKPIFSFLGNGYFSPVITKDSILISTSPFNHDGKIYCIDRNTGKLRWERQIYGLNAPTLVCNNESLFFVDLQKEIKNRLLEVDIMTGTVIKQFTPREDIWYSYADYVTTSRIDFDGENILLRGDYYFVYNLETKKITKNIKRPSNDILLNGKIIYYESDLLYTYDIAEKSTGKIYKFWGKQVYRIFARDEYVFLVMAKNVHSALANGLDFTYVMLKLD